MIKTSAAINQRTNNSPAPANAVRACAIHRALRRHTGGDDRTLMTTKKPSPISTTGIPNRRDWGDVVTAVQLSSPVPEHARIVVSVKCAIVMYVERPTPIRLKTNAAAPTQRVSGAGEASTTALPLASSSASSTRSAPASVTLGPSTKEAIGTSVVRPRYHLQHPNVERDESRCLKVEAPSTT